MRNTISPAGASSTADPNAQRCDAGNGSQERQADKTVASLPCARVLDHASLSLQIGRRWPGRALNDHDNVLL